MTFDDDALTGTVAAFVRERIIPFQRDPRNGGHGPSDDLRREIQALARAEGLLAPHVSRDNRGLGLNHWQIAAVSRAGVS